MFNHSFPLIGLVAVVVNVLLCVALARVAPRVGAHTASFARSIRMESHRLVTYSRRPESRSANNLGTWYAARCVARAPAWLADRAPGRRCSLLWP